MDRGADTCAGRSSSASVRWCFAFGFARIEAMDPERQANIAFLLIFLGIIAVGGLTIWLFYGASF